MAFFNTVPVDAIYMSREDSSNPLASYSKHGFDLDGYHWPSVEHYFQAMKFNDDVLKEKIRQAVHPKEAAKLAKRNFWKVRKDWKKVQRVVMTRGTYTKCKTHPEVTEELLATGEKVLVEDSLYDHYWGCGRDQRGNNYYGKMLMDVRKRLAEE